MRRQGMLLLGVGLALVLGACHGKVDGTGKGPTLIPPGGWPAASSLPDPCQSDPDNPASVSCGGGGWECARQSGHIECKKPDYAIPGGTASQWTCTDQGNYTQCEGVNDTVPHNDDLWTCSVNERHKIVCITKTPDQPMQGGPWVCVYEDVSGVVCTSQDTGTWGCIAEAGTTVCKDTATTPNTSTSAKWECRNEAGGEICHSAQPNQVPDYPSGSTPPTGGTGTTGGTGPGGSSIPTWACVSDANGTTCTASVSDQPSFGGPWVCVFDDVGGVMCKSEQNGTWACAVDAQGVTTCRQESPNVPSSSGTWQCYDTAGTTVCTGGTGPGGTIPGGTGPGGTGPGGTPPGGATGPGTYGPGWVCLTDDVGRVVCTTTTPENPSNTGNGPNPVGGTITSGTITGGTMSGGTTTNGTTTGATITNGTITGATINTPSGPITNATITGATVTGATVTGGTPVGGTITGGTITGGTVTGGTPPPGTSSGPGTNGGTWNCWFDDVGARVCNNAPTTSTVFNPAHQMEGLCVPGVRRWCDGATYCSWGQQTCKPDGSWGDCLENSGIRPNTLCGCYYFYFNAECCETPDCVIPPGTTGQTCPANQGNNCDYCDGRGQCPNGAKCVFADDGEAYCTRACDASSCPTGYQCTSIKAKDGSLSKVCVPADKSCYK